ncbi:hypothetical protein RHK41_19860 [Clostridioides difficile]|nr:hypothetical protein [Clostridioides difficile]
MNRKKLTLPVLALLGLLTAFNINSLKSSAWGGDDGGGGDTVIKNSRITWDMKTVDATGRPQSGTFHKNQIMSKNPLFGDVDGAYVGGGGRTYVKNGGKVRSAIKSGYGFDLLYYEQYADKDGKVYKSPDADGTKENFYTKMDSTLTSGYRNRYWNLNWNGSQTNFSKVNVEPNYQGRKKYQMSTNNNVSNNYDARFDKDGEWRYLGYNLRGEPLTNPFFSCDGSGTETHMSDFGILWQGEGCKKFGDWLEYNSISYELAKKQAIERLLKKDPQFKNGTLIQVANNNKQSKKVSGGNISADVWMNSLSLLTDPEKETPIFRVYRVKTKNWNDKTFKGKSSLNAYTIVAPINVKQSQDVTISDIKLIDKSGAVLKQFKRDDSGNTSTVGKGTVTPGEKYKVEYTIKNNGDVATKTMPNTIDVGTATDANATKNDYTQKYPNNNTKGTLSGGGFIEAGKTVTLTKEVTVPADTKTAFRVTGYIGDVYNKTDNKDQTNDWGHVVASVEGKEEEQPGDLKVNNIKMIDKNGKEALYMKPGEEYKIRYIVDYHGPSKEFWQTRTDSEGNTTRYRVKKAFKFNWTAKRYLPQGGSELYKNNKTLNLYGVDKGESWQFETPYFVWEVPRAEATIAVNAPVSVDLNKGNNTAQKKWFYNYDVKVSNVKVFNDKERPIQDSFITLGVKYDVDVIAPSQTPNFETDIKTHITLPNGQILQFIDHVKKGSNKNITREIKVPITAITSGSKKLNVNVYANADKHFWENDLNTQANNKGSNYSTQLPPINPVASGGCSIFNTENNWNVAHKTLNYNGKYIKYKKFDGSREYDFYRYTNGTSQTKNESYYEEYNIKSVKFKSKYTTDKGYGWVDLTKVADRKKAKIKAGYGYELDITVEYNTNALTAQPKAWDTRNTSTSKGLSVTNQNMAPNIYKDIYVKTADGKTLSATGIYGSQKVFDVTVVSTNADKTVLKYKMKKKSKNGVEEPIKIYTGTNTKDGFYSLDVWTPELTGVGSTKSKDKLCDEKNLEFEVKGSMWDDTNDHIVQ